jgi:hypothetical protein
LVSTAYHRTSNTLVAKRWFEAAGGRKTAARGALDNEHVAKVQFQLLSIFFGFAQLFNPRLYLIYRIKDDVIANVIDPDFMAALTGAGSPLLPGPRQIRSFECQARPGREPVARVHGTLLLLCTLQTQEQFLRGSVPMRF